MSIKTVADLKCLWFHARGTRVYDVKQEWQNTQFVTVLGPSEYQAGDNYLMQCALGFCTDAQWRDYFNKAGNFGVTARGLISFGDAYTKLLQAHRMKTGTGGPAGITFTGYNNAVGSIESKGKGALILGTTIVGRLALSLSKEWVSVQVGYYDIPCLGSGNEVVSCRVRETDFSIRRPHKKGIGVVESDEDIITKFLKFGLSLSDMSFPNVCELIVYCGQPVNGSVDMGKIAGELDKATQKKVPYANPNIIYNVRKGNSVVKMESLLRPLTEELTSKLRDCKYQPSFFGRTGNAYWGDYLVNRSMQTPFDFGATVEETAVNCIDYCNKHRWGNYTKQEDATKDFDAVEWESDAVEEQAVQGDSFDDVEWEKDDNFAIASEAEFDDVVWEEDDEETEKGIFEAVNKEAVKGPDLTEDGLYKNLFEFFYYENVAEVGAALHETVDNGAKYGNEDHLIFVDFVVPMELTSRIAWGFHIRTYDEVRTMSDSDVDDYWDMMFKHIGDCEYDFKQKYGIKPGDCKYSFNVCLPYIGDEIDRRGLKDGKTRKYGKIWRRRKGAAAKYAYPDDWYHPYDAAYAGMPNDVWEKIKKVRSGGGAKGSIKVVLPDDASIVDYKVNWPDSYAALRDNKGVFNAESAESYLKSAFSVVTAYMIECGEDFWVIPKWLQNNYANAKKVASSVKHNEGAGVVSNSSVSAEFVHSKGASVSSDFSEESKRAFRNWLGAELEDIELCLSRLKSEFNIIESCDVSKYTDRWDALSKTEVEQRIKMAKEKADALKEYVKELCEKRDAEQKEKVEKLEEAVKEERWQAEKARRERLEKQLVKEEGQRRMTIVSREVLQRKEAEKEDLRRYTHEVDALWDDNHDLFTKSFNVVSSYHKDRMSDKNMTWERIAEICSSLPELVQLYNKAFIRLKTELEELDDKLDRVMAVNAFSIVFHRVVTEVAPMLKVSASYYYGKDEEGKYTYLPDRFYSKRANTLIELLSDRAIGMRCGSRFHWEKEANRSELLAIFARVEKNLESFSHLLASNLQNNLDNEMLASLGGFAKYFHF